MRTFVKEKKKESMMNSPLGSSLKDNPPFKSSMPIDRPPMNFPSKSITKSDEDEFDVDELIKKKVRTIVTNNIDIYKKYVNEKLIIQILLKICV